MKRHGNLWDAITHPDNLLEAYRKARKGKGWRRSILAFEKNLNANLLRLQRLLCTGAYKTSKYSCKTIYEPKERVIYKLPFAPDRIVQHALLQVVSPIWDKLMIDDSYACRKGRGMHQASRKTMQCIRLYKYCLKADISKFYPSIDHDILMQIICRKIKCKQTLALIEDIARSFPGGKNAPIGNYTSQWFGNLYMNELDQAIKHQHKIDGYIRYCDDFVLFDNCKRRLNDLLKWIERFLSDRLRLRFSRASVFPVAQGVDFVGYRHFRRAVLLRRSTAKRIQKRMSQLPVWLERSVITLDQYRSSIASSEGWLKWANTYNLRLTINIQTLKRAYA